MSEPCRMKQARGTPLWCGLLPCARPARVHPGPLVLCDSSIRPLSGPAGGTWLLSLAEGVVFELRKVSVASRKYVH